MPAEITIGGRAVGGDHPTYFVADIGANHDGDLDRAKLLIRAAAAAGADAAKFQNFEADTIVSDAGFAALGGRQSHQAAWMKSPYEVYRDASLAPAWTPELRAECDAAGVHYFTSPYSPDLVDLVDPFVPAHKIGSGDITWLEIVDHIASKEKPVLLATGASSLEEVERAVDAVLRRTSKLVLMQCNTNYTGDPSNIGFVNLRVLKTFADRFPEAVLGLSDHTPGDVAVLGAVALGARVVEKHFTDDNRRVGPDHAFAMTPEAWQTMVERTRELEQALGDGEKRVEPNELDTVVLQRRAVRAARPIEAGEVLTRADVIPLRPCPAGAIGAEDVGAVVGRTVVRPLAEGDALAWSDVD